MANPILTEVKGLARHLPVLGGVIGVVALSIVSISMAEHVVRQLLGNGGNVTALVSRHMETFAAVSLKATAWGEQILAIFGVR